MKILVILLLICGFASGQFKNSAAIKLALDLDLSVPDPTVSPEFNWFAYKVWFDRAKMRNTETT